MAGQAAIRPDPDASLSGFVPDLRPPLHARVRESLRGLVNQSGLELMVYEFAMSIAWKGEPGFCNLVDCNQPRPAGSVQPCAGTARPWKVEPISEEVVPWTKISCANWRSVSDRSMRDSDWVSRRTTRHKSSARASSPFA